MFLFFITYIDLVMATRQTQRILYTTRLFFAQDWRNVLFTVVTHLQTRFDFPQVQQVPSKVLDMEAYRLRHPMRTAEVEIELVWLNMQQTESQIGEHGIAPTPEAIAAHLIERHPFAFFR